jgi:hypothetical protein
MTEMILWPWVGWEGSSDTAPGEVEPGPAVEGSIVTPLAHLR